MNLADVMSQIASRLDTIDGLRVFAYPPDSLQPPAAVVSYPESISFDSTYARGMDRMTLPVVAVVGRVPDRNTATAIAAYANGSGSSSFKYVLETGAYSAFHTVTVTSVEFDVVTIAGTDYMAALFDLDIVGSGS